MMSNKIKILINIIILIFFSSATLAKRDHLERWYQQNWCNQNNGIVEYQFPDKTRCDCLTNTHAIEFDFGNKWAEAIGQALFYGFQTGKTPGIVLIIEKETDQKYWIRLNSVVKYYSLPIKTWMIEEK